MAADIIPLTGRWRPPDRTDADADAAKVRQDQSGGGDLQSTTWTGSFSKSSVGGARPHVVVERRSAIRLVSVPRWPDGRTEELQIFNDPYAAARNAQRLDAAIARCRQ